MRMRGAQGPHGDVLGGVQVAELEGHVSRFAVYLVHKGLGRRRAEMWRMNPPSDLVGKKRMLSQAACERPVTGSTSQGQHRSILFFDAFALLFQSKEESF
jgi:hypothetical protein